MCSLAVNADCRTLEDRAGRMLICFFFVCRVFFVSACLLACFRSHHSPASLPQVQRGYSRLVHFVSEVRQGVPRVHHHGPIADPSHGLRTLRVQSMQTQRYRAGDEKSATLPTMPQSTQMRDADASGEEDSRHNPSHGSRMQVAAFMRSPVLQRRLHFKAAGLYTLFSNAIQTWQFERVQRIDPGRSRSH